MEFLLKIVNNLNVLVTLVQMAYTNGDVAVNVILMIMGNVEESNPSPLVLEILLLLCCVCVSVV